jgi:hypothetical protein
MMIIQNIIIMEHQVLTKVEDRIQSYQAEHQGEKPLYIIMADDEADRFIAEVKAEEGYDDHIMITEYKGSKIVKNVALKPGEIQLSNELPETGS